MVVHISYFDNLQKSRVRRYIRLLYYMRQLKEMHCKYEIDLSKSDLLCFMLQSLGLPQIAAVFRRWSSEKKTAAISQIFRRGKSGCLENDKIRRLSFAFAITACHFSLNKLK